MREILRKTIYQKILKEYCFIGTELRSRRRLRFTKLICSLDKIHGLLIHKDSWEKVKIKKKRG